MTSSNRSPQSQRMRLHIPGEALRMRTGAGREGGGGGRTRGGGLVWREFPNKGSSGYWFHAWFI